MVAKLWVRPRKIRLTQHHVDRLRTHKESRRRANKYWNKLCSEYQGVDNRCATKTTYKNVKVALRPQVNKVAPIKSKICWKYLRQELGSELLEKTLFWAILSRKPLWWHHPTSHLVQIDRTGVKYSRATDDLSSGKAPGKDVIPA